MFLDATESERGLASVTPGGGTVSVKTNIRLLFVSAINETK